MYNTTLNVEPKMFKKNNKSKTQKYKFISHVMIQIKIKICFTV